MSADLPSRPPRRPLRAAGVDYDVATARRSAGVRQVATLAPRREAALSPVDSTSRNCIGECSHERRVGWRGPVDAPRLGIREPDGESVRDHRPEPDALDRQASEPFRIGDGEVAQHQAGDHPLRGGTLETAPEARPVGAADLGAGVLRTRELRCDLGADDPTEVAFLQSSCQSDSCGRIHRLRDHGRRFELRIAKLVGGHARALKPIDPDPVDDRPRDAPEVVLRSSRRLARQPGVGRVGVRSPVTRVIAADKRRAPSAPRPRPERGGRVTARRRPAPAGRGRSRGAGSRWCPRR